MVIEREEKDRQTDRHTDRQIDRDKHIYRGIERQGNGRTNRTAIGVVGIEVRKRQIEREKRQMYIERNIKFV